MKTIVWKHARLPIHAITKSFFIFTVLKRGEMVTDTQKEKQRERERRQRCDVAVSLRKQQSHLCLWGRLLPCRQETTVMSLVCEVILPTNVWRAQMWNKLLQRSAVNFDIQSLKCKQVAKVFRLVIGWLLRSCYCRWRDRSMTFYKLCRFIHQNFGKILAYSIYILKKYIVILRPLKRTERTHTADVLKTYIIRMLDMIIYSSITEMQYNITEVQHSSWILHASLWMFHCLWLIKTIKNNRDHVCVCRTRIFMSLEWADLSSVCVCVSCKVLYMLHICLF